MLSCLSVYVHVWYMYVCICEHKYVPEYMHVEARGSSLDVFNYSPLLFETVSHWIWRSHNSLDELANKPWGSSRLSFPPVGLQQLTKMSIILWYEDLKVDPYTQHMSLPVSHLLSPSFYSISFFMSTGDWTWELALNMLGKHFWIKAIPPAFCIIYTVSLKIFSVLCLLLHIQSPFWPFSKVCHSCLGKLPLFL